jgi:hypothetical protein
LRGRPDLQDHLLKFLADLEEINFKIDRTITGTHKINTSLLILNDLIRLCFDLTVRRELSEGLCDPVLRSLNDLSSFPQIYCPFVPSEMTNAPGLLTLIDTPGQDETKLSHILRRNNETVLAESDAICVIVNATPQGNEAETEILKLVPQDTLSKLYVVINKADTPNKRPQQVKQFRATLDEFNAKLPQPLAIPDDHIFPLSALRASLSMTLSAYKAENGEVCT